jgi:hypothetical protein
VSPLYSPKGGGEFSRQIPTRKSTPNDVQNQLSFFPMKALVVLQKIRALPGAFTIFL